MTNFYQNSLTILENDLLARSPIKRSTLQKQVRKDISENIQFDSIILEDQDVQAWIRMDENWRVLNAGHNSLIGKYFKTPRQHDDLIQLVEDFTISMYMIMRSRTLLDKYVAIATYAKLRGTKMDLSVLAVATLRAAYDHYMTDDKLEVQGYEFSDFKSFLGMYDTIKNSPAFEKLYKFGMYALSLSLFSKLGLSFDLFKFDEIAKEGVKKKFHMGPDFIHSTLDTITFLCERGYQCCVTGSMSPLFHSEMQYQVWYDKAEKLHRQSNFLNNPVVHNIDRFQYLADLKDSIEQGKSIKQFANRPAEKALISKLLCSLELVHAMEVTKRSAQQERAAPFSVLVYGGSSVGKSTFTNLLFLHYGKVLGLNTHAEFKYTRNPTEEFWSNFNSTQWCIQMDDIGFQSPNLGVMDPSLAEMLCVVNNVPYVPAQAELADKGRTPVRAKLVIGSTNSESLNVHAYFACPLAVQRRFPYVIDIEPKSEYARGTMLNSSSIPELSEGYYPDYWNIKVSRVVPSGTDRKGQKGKLVHVLSFTAITEFMTWYSKTLLEHEETQRRVLSCSNVMEKIEICKTCYAPSAMCKCATGFSPLPQSDTFCLTCSNPYTECDCVEEDEVEESPKRKKKQVHLMNSRKPKRKTKMDVQAMTLSDIGVPNFINNMYTDTMDWFKNEPTYNVHTYMATMSYASRCYITMWFAFYKIVSYFPWISAIFMWLFGPDWLVKYAIGVNKSFVARHVLSYGFYKMKHDLSIPSKLLKFTIGAVAFVALYKTIKSFFISLDGDVQGSVMSAGKDPIPDADNRKNVSYQDPFRISVDDLSQHTLCAKGKDSTLLKAHITKATVMFSSCHDGITRVGTAVNVRGNVYMCNSHIIPPCDQFLLNIVDNEDFKINSSLKNILITPGMIKRDPNHDLAFIKIMCRPPATNLLPYFCLSTYTGKIDGSYIGKDIAGKVWEEKVCNIYPALTRWDSHGTKVEKPIWRGTVSNPTVNGNCGAMLLAETPSGPIILGTHIMGKDSAVGIMRINRDYATKMCDIIEPKFISRGSLPISAPSCIRTIGALNVQSVVHKANSGSAEILGSFVGEFRQRGKTNVGPTLIQEAVLKRADYELTKTKPDMTRKPWVKALNDMTRPVTLMNSDTIDICVDEFKNRIKDCDFTKVTVYTDKVAVNGAAGVRYCDKLNRKSSAGCPYKRSKKHYLTFIEKAIQEDIDDDYVEPNEEIKNTMEEIVATYLRGERYSTVFCGHLKDEAVSFAKAANGGTRLFTSSAMAWSIVVRKYLLSVIVFMQNNREMFECGPGIVAQSREWEKLYKHITKHGLKKMVAGDYGKFDKRMSPKMILAAFDIILYMCEKAGYSEDELKVVRGIAYDVAYPVVDFNGELIQFFGGNPSGHPLTVIINGLVNSLYMRYCYYELNPLRECRSFDDNVVLMTYGDDNIMSVADAAPWFNHTTIQAVLANVDIVYTMADKEAASIPYIDIAECSFLKRTWRYDSDIDCWMGPLDPSSISKMLTVSVASRNISPKAHAIQVIGTAMREYFMYGREEFESRKEMFREIVTECDLDLYVEHSTFPTWNELSKAFEGGDWVIHEPVEVMMF